MLNFNIVALMAVPSLALTWKRWRLFLALTPMYVTLASWRAWERSRGHETAGACEVHGENYENLKLLIVGLTLTAIAPGCCW